MVLEFSSCPGCMLEA
ncbi:hypothetical protein MTR67_001313 [Solanum verrucosum]|uniref:Uncharacterized protein n=1 Tax=Solanum verrucosum TaxID=315347 RepID=A0AAF0T8B6_SOLVR|nr:hypothetical protein MTR67_001313 [Solanum verrucosum]